MKCKHEYEYIKDTFKNKCKKCGQVVGFEGEFFIPKATPVSVDEFLRHIGIIKYTQKTKKETNGN